MMRTLRLQVLAVCALFGLLLLSGCGAKKGAPVKGKLILPPEVKLAENDSVSVNLIPESTTAQGYSGSVSKTDLTFTIDSPNKKGVAPGKYKVAASIQAYPGSADAAQRQPLLDTFNKTYGAANTRMTYEVTADSNQSITVDLTKGTVSKN